MWPIRGAIPPRVILAQYFPKNGRKIPSPSVCFILFFGLFMVVKLCQREWQGEHITHMKQPRSFWAEKAGNCHLLRGASCSSNWVSCLWGELGGSAAWRRLLRIPLHALRFTFTVCWTVKYCEYSKDWGIISVRYTVVSVTVYMCVSPQER